MTRDLPNEPLAAGENGALSASGCPPKPALWRAPRWSFASVAWGTAALCAAAASVVAAPGWGGVLGGGLAVAMIAIAAVDAREFIIPNKLVMAGVLLGLADAALTGQRQPAAAVAQAALRAFVLALVFFLFRAAYRRWRGREGIGLGDVKLAAVGGAWLAWGAAGLAIDFAALSALAAVLIGMLLGRSFSATTRVPFGLFFAPAIWIAWLLVEITAGFNG
jgi:leader peptidase (prepilin peptidase) / N-methyltransferase